MRCDHDITTLRVIIMSFRYLYTMYARQRFLELVSMRVALFTAI